METKQKKLLSEAFDCAYNLKYNGRVSGLIKAKIEIFMDDLTKEAKSLGYDFRLCEKTQKFKITILQ